MQPSTIIDRTRQPPRVLFLIDEMSSITAGGTERQLLQLIRITQKCGLSPQVCVLRNTAWLTEEVAGCPVKCLHWHKLISFASFGRAWHAMRWMRHEKFHLLHTIFSESNLVGPWLGCLAGIPVIFGHRRNMNPSAKSKFQFSLVIQRLTNLLTRAILVNSEAVLRRTHATEATPYRKLLVIHNGIDVEGMAVKPGLREQTRQALHIECGELLIGNLSGLRHIKGIDTFVDAAATMHTSAPHLRFIVIGEGVLRGQIQMRIDQKGLRDVCTIADSVEDVRPYLAAMDIAVLCSRAEGFSNSLLEYMASGLPIIATDVGGNREAVGGNGLLIPPNDPAALARAMTTLLDHRYREALGTAAKRVVQQFDLSAAEARMAKIYRQYLPATSVLPERQKKAIPLDQPQSQSHVTGITTPANLQLLDSKESW